MVGESEHQKKKNFKSPASDDPPRDLIHYLGSCTTGILVDRGTMIHVYDGSAAFRLQRHEEDCLGRLHPCIDQGYGDIWSA